MPEATTQTFRPRRTIALVRLFWMTSIAAELEYRLNFIVASLTSMGGLAGSLFGLHLFYRTGHQLGGWSRDESLAVLGCFTLLMGVAETILSPNLSRIVQMVQQGTLDFVLLKPIDSQLWVSTRSISLWGLPDVLLGLGLILFSAWSQQLGALAVLSALPALLCGIVTLYSLWFVLAALSIWFVKIYNVTEVLRGLLEAGRFPMDAYPVAYRFFFTFIVPVAFLTTVPAETLAGRGSPYATLGALLLAVASFYGARRFWRTALRSYTSASS